MITKELQDYVWACLPREFREEVKKEYAKCVAIDIDDNPNLPAYAVESAISRRALLEMLFGHHNLTSDADGEEMLMVRRKKVQAFFMNFKCEKSDAKSTFDKVSLGARMSMLHELFGSKCLPDELNEDNFAKSEPKPSEPKNEGTRQEQYVPKNAESGTRSFDAILKDGFRNECRLNIATRVLCGMMADPISSNIQGKPTPVIVEWAYEIADALIAKVEKGAER